MDFFLFIINMLWMYESTIYVWMNWMWRLSLRIATMSLIFLYVYIKTNEKKKYFFYGCIEMKWAAWGCKKTFLLLFTRQWISEYWEIFSFYLFVYFPQLWCYLYFFASNSRKILVCLRLQQNNINLLSIEASFSLIVLIFHLNFHFNIHFNWIEIKFISPSLLSFVFRSTSQTSNFLIEINQMWVVFIC